jgi:hypothetical protein
MFTSTAQCIRFTLVVIGALPITHLLMSMTVGGNATAAEVAYVSDGLRGSECDDPNCPGCQAFFKACGKTCSYDSGCDCGAGIPYDTSGSDSGLDFSGSPETPAPASSPGLAMSQQFGGGSNQFAVADAPNMFGDSIMTLNATFMGSSFSSGIPSTRVDTRIPIGGGDGRYKISDNYSPLPRDRVFFNYHHFHNAVEDIAGTRNNLNRYTFGLEKTVFNKRASLEIRIPFASGLDSNQFLTAGAGQTATEFGNIMLAAKTLAYKTDQLAFSFGLGVTLPAAGDARVVLDGVNLARPAIYDIRNEAVYLQPFLGMLYAPDDRLFVQGYAGVDFDANGNGVTFTEIDPNGSTPNTFQDSGNYRSQHFLLLDLSIGYWAYRNRCASGITGMAPIVELHYMSTVNATDSYVVDGNFLGEDGITNSYNRMDILNITGGLHFAIEDLSSLRVIASAPLRDDEEAFFDAEVAVQFNRRF